MNSLSYRSQSLPLATTMNSDRTRDSLVTMPRKQSFQLRMTEHNTIPPFDAPSNPSIPVTEDSCPVQSDASSKGPDPPPFEKITLNGIQIDPETLACLVNMFETAMTNFPTLAANDERMPSVFTVRNGWTSSLHTETHGTGTGRTQSHSRTSCQGSPCNEWEIASYEQTSCGPWSRRIPTWRPDGTQQQNER